MGVWGSEWGTACRKPRPREAEWFLFHVHYASSEPAVPEVTELGVKGEKKGRGVKLILRLGSPECSLGVF